MKIIGKALIPLVLVAAVLTSCNSSITTRTSQTDVMETAMSVETAVVKTQLAIPTSTLLTPSPIPFGSPTAIPDPYSVTIITPNPDQQVYTDPAGWYSVNFPADMTPTDKPNSFSRQGGFFETGYLPELGYMSNSTSVCGWVANIEFESQQSIIDWSSVYLSLPKSYPRCSVSTETGDWKYEIYENPGAKPEHRFIYLKSGKTYPSANPVQTVFSWLKPVGNTLYEPNLIPLSPEEIAMWGNTAPILQSASVTEYALPTEAQAGPSEEMLLHFVPEEMLPKWTVNETNASYKAPTIEEQLKPLGFELKPDETYIGLKQLFRDGRLLFDHVTGVSDVYTFATNSEPIMAFVVNTAGTGGNYYNSFLIQNDAVNEWDYNHQDPRFAPISYQGEPLWLKATKDFHHIQIIKSNREVVYSFAIYTEPIYSTDRFAAWNDHWILAARNFLIQDGEIVNEKLGFQEIFSWNLIEDKPIYLFRKGPRIGFSYDGKILPLEYQDIAHHFCCGLASNNPYVGDDAVHFFGIRDGVWYYVVVKIK